MSEELELKKKHEKELKDLKEKQLQSLLDLYSKWNNRCIILRFNNPEFANCRGGGICYIANKYFKAKINSRGEVEQKRLKLVYAESATNPFQYTVQIENPYDNKYNDETDYLKREIEGIEITQKDFNQLKSCFKDVSLNAKGIIENLFNNKGITNDYYTTGELRSEEFLDRLDLIDIPYIKLEPPETVILQTSPFRIHSNLYLITPVSIQVAEDLINDKEGYLCRVASSGYDVEKYVSSERAIIERLKEKIQKCK